jgi:CheY-like chemotaxis protein
MPELEALKQKIDRLEHELEGQKNTVKQFADAVNELNNLLALMKGHAQLASQDPSDGTRIEFVDAVLESTSRAQEIIKNTMAGSAAADREQAPEEPAVISHANILVVDDEKLLCTLVARILVQGGHTVTQANSGHEAIEACRKQTFDIIFLDLRLGDMNGVDVFRKIRSLPSTSRVVFFSGDPSIKDVSRLVHQEGADGFIRKPFDINEIKNVVSYILSRPTAPIYLSQNLS